MLPLVIKPLAMLLPRGFGLPSPSAVRPARVRFPEPGRISDPYQHELLRSYASAAITAVVTINSGALIGGLSQAANLDFLTPAALALALSIWALGVTVGVGTWGAAYHAVVAQIAGDDEEQLRWMRIATNLFHLSLTMFLAGFLAVGFSVLA